ncbi:hypothetical protein [Aliarcobacter skirrowii]|uniref:Type IV secretion system protein n=1 Tax=Aliarcobacter skirrowii CCUG 10374 TaxID=1032239 RepID=A0AAD0SLR7_9BACT|nr:hypothetical protein [Aliarcobacter skirrowii]AXX85117.1 hypothetical protein ASKIR_1313 [Aliarcobacter skirrowii CCUG 10374]KAB0620724.1 hypothetical protein F7P70_06195 [Aliarcobacter skirrowii CCUG 10374]RXI25930.1 hypothetical protein CP959_06415 [Aliarcobacter skirrowii CCUG 10374]SUU96357.1 Uncharacterised protein [Aliarcobacter skirrowii]
MRAKKFTTVIIISFYLIPNLFGAAQVVTDPISYTHYIDQIKEFQKQVELMTKQVETLGGIKTATDDVKRQIYTVKEQFTDAFMGLMNAGQKLGEAGGKVGETFKQIGSYKKDSITTNSGDGGFFYEDMAKMIDGFFETTGTMDVAKFFHLNDEQLRKSLKNDTQQMAHYKIVAGYEFLEESLSHTNKVVNDIMKTVFNDSEPSMIEMQKVTNMLLYNMIIMQQQSIALQNDLAFAMSLEKYHGVNHKDFQKRINALNDEDETRKEKYLEDQKTKIDNVNKISNEYDIHYLFGY